MIFKNIKFKRAISSFLPLNLHYTLHHDFRKIQHSKEFERTEQGINAKLLSDE